MIRFFTFFLVFLSSILFSQKSEIMKVLHQQQKDWNEANIEAYMESYWKNDSLVFVGSGGAKYGWHTTLNNYKKSYPNKEAMGTLTFSNVKIIPMNKSNAFVSGVWQLHRANDVLKGNYSLLLRKIKGKWLIVYDHSS